MKLQTRVRAGGVALNHNERLVMAIRTHIRAGGIPLNHNERLV
jgi:hypothetical protein